MIKITPGARCHRAAALALCVQFSLAARAGDIADRALDEITVVGEKKEASGLSEPAGPNEFALDKKDWADVLTGTNALALVKNVPGVSFTASDAYGLDESDASLFVRGFHMNEMAVLFEGIPLNDTSYPSLTGMNVADVGVPGDIGSVKISPGAARESAFSNSANGGEIRYGLAPLSNTPGISVSQSYGSNDTLVTGASLQTGKVSPDGPKMLVGFERISKDKYDDAGTQYALRGDIKIEQDVPWGDFTLFFSGNHAEIWGYDDLSFGMIKRLGWNADYAYPNYRQAYIDALPQNANASCGAYSCGQLASLTPYDSGQATTDLIGSVGHHFTLAPGVSGTVTVYGAHDDIHAALSDPSTPSANGAPFSEQVWHPRSTRVGGTAEVKYELETHTVTAGLWFEHTDSAADTAWYNEPLLGQGDPLKTIGPYDVHGAAFQTANQSRWRTLSRQAYLHDDYSLTDQITVGAGFKAIDFSTAGGGIGPDHAPNGSLAARNGFLPHLSVDWRPDADTDLYLDAAETESGYRVFPRGSIGYSASPWTASDQQTYDAATRSIHPERDWNLTLGASHGFGGVSVTGDVYYSLIDNRMLTAEIGDLHNPTNTVGEVPHAHVFGADAGTTIRLMDGVRFYQGVAASRFSYDDDLTVGGTTYPIKGKAQPGYPAVSLVSDLSVSYRSMEAGVSSTEYLRQPFSYTNDLYGPDYWLVNAHLSYALDEILFRLDANNLFNRKTIGTLGVDGFPFSGDYQSMNRAAPRQLLFTVSAKY